MKDGTEQSKCGETDAVVIKKLSTNYKIFKYSYHKFDNTKNAIQFS